MILRLAYRSLRNRWLTSVLTLFSIALGVALFLGIERVRLGVRESFSSAISHTDLIAGARGGSLPLLLYSVFHIGNATNNISYRSYKHFKEHPAVEWTIPYSMGDSHRGYRVIATDESFYKNFRFHGDRQIEFIHGKNAEDVFDVVLGFEIAEKLGYRLNGKVTLTHGISEGPSIYEHGDKPFHVVGILKRTSTPVDRSLYITLEGMEAIHIDWKDGAPPMPGEENSAANLKKENLKIGQITSFLLRTHSRIDALHLQREIQEYSDEPLMAIIPGAALSELWNGIGYAEEALRIVSFFVILVGILGLFISLLTSLDERRREMAILRVLGAGARRMVSLLVLETFLLTFLGAVSGVVIVYVSLYFSRSWIENNFGLFIPITSLSWSDYFYLGALLVGSLIAGVLPAIKAYRTSLVDGLTPKI